MEITHAALLNVCVRHTSKWQNSFRTSVLLLLDKKCQMLTTLTKLLSLLNCRLARLYELYTEINRRCLRNNKKITAKSSLYSQFTLGCVLSYQSNLCFTYHPLHAPSAVFSPCERTDAEISLSPRTVLEISSAENNRNWQSIFRMTPNLHSHIS